MGWWQQTRDKLDALMEQYGWIALGTYLVIFAVTWTGFYVAIQAGLELDSAAGKATVVGAACAANKGIQPLRIVAAIALTPAVAWVLERVRPRPAGAPAAAPETPSTTEPPSPG